MKTRTATGIETVWCEQCGEVEATVIVDTAVLCQACADAAEDE